MKIIKRRVRNVETYLSTVKENEEFHIAFLDFENHTERLNQIGFTIELNIGEQVLPMILGPISRFNSDGKYNIRRDLPKEEIFIERFWNRRDYQGNEHPEYYYIRRERYPRELVPPPCEELLIHSYNENKIIVSKSFIKNDANLPEIKHTLNLFLEIFGECDLLRENYAPFLYENVTKLNWKIFPRGEYPWETVREIATERLERQPKGNRPVISNRLEKITSHIPNFVAVGQGGFYDYVVFGFPLKNIFILESIKNGNATYVFDNNWEQLSQMTKADILNNQLQTERIFHRPGWETRVNEILT